MHRQPWPYMDYMDSYTLPYCRYCNSENRVCLSSQIFENLTNINRIIKLLLQQNSAAKIKYIYLILSRNIKSKYF